jgi:flagellar biosynthetic protein FlhB
MSDSAQEKTELATQKRRDEASDKGQIAYSRELVAAFLFGSVLICLRYVGGPAAATLSQFMERAFSLEDYDRVAGEGFSSLVDVSTNAYLEVALPLLATVFIVALLGSILQVGFSISLQRIEVKWSKLNPLSGIKKLFSMRSVFSLIISVAKLLVVGAVVYSTLRSIIPRAQNLSLGDLDAVVALFVESVFTISLRVGIILLIIGVIDFAWQRWRHSKDLMMSKEDVKQESKQSDGDPKVKGRIRQIQRDLARSRMMQATKTATVVVRNPTHYAVALKYEAGKDRAPKVVAKGRNLMALRIIQIAEDAGVPVRTDPPLARQIYKTVKVGRSIPEELFQAVAKVLAWVYRTPKRNRPAA